MEDEPITDLTANLITEEWLAGVGFQWHEVERSPHKHWVLWLGEGLREGRRLASFDDLGIELTMGANLSSDPPAWFCWLRSDSCHRYHRFLHVRTIETQSDVIRLVEGLTGRDWHPENHYYGSLLSPERAYQRRRDDERLDQRWTREGPKWYGREKDDTRSGAILGETEKAE